jgi:phasin family protein
MPNPMMNVYPQNALQKPLAIINIAKSYTIPRISLDVLIEIQRKNISALTAINQVAFQNMQSFAQRQSELMRHSMEEATSLMGNIVTSHTPQDKALYQVEITKIMVEKCMAHTCVATTMFSECSNKAMQTVSTRMTEGLEEIRNLIKLEAVTAP